MKRRFAVVAALTVLCASIVGATTLVKLEFADLARDADRIVVGTVTGIEGFWDDSMTFVHSNVTVRVEKSFRGDAADELVLRTPGGAIGGIAQVAHGAPSFAVGEQVLVFLTTWEDGTAKVLGYAQGKSTVLPDDTGRLRLHGGVSHGRTLDDVASELRHGPRHNIPLRKAN